MDIAKGYHCAYQMHFHIVFPVKYRRALLEEPVIFAIKEISLQIQERYEMEIERIGCDRDHIHLLVSLYPEYSPGSFVRIFKSVTAQPLFQRFPRLREELWGGEFWSDGYYIATVGERGDWSVVGKYIRAQGMNPEEMQLRLL